jgi:hypothetical protein
MLNSFFCCKVPKTEKSETMVEISSSTQQNHSPVLKHESTKEKEKEKEKIKEKEKSKKIPSKKKEEPEKIFSTQISFSNFKEGNFEEEKSPQTKKLLLTGELFFNKELIITHYGLINSRRQKNDNQTFFGITEGNDYTGTPYNDFIINLQNENNEDKIPSNGRIFGISYSKKTHDYQLYILNGNYYIYYEIRDSLYFFNNKEYLFLLGRTFLTVTQKDINKVKSLEIKMESEDDNNIDPNKVLNYNKNDSPITIGRINSKININSTCISKQHAVIEFNEEEGKFLFKDLQSTNGSILIMKDDDVIKLNGFMKFKLNDILFNILELP